MIYEKAFWFCQKVGAWILCSLSLYANPVYVFTVFLFYLYSITKAKYWRLHKINQQTEESLQIEKNKEI